MTPERKVRHVTRIVVEGVTQDKIRTAMGTDEYATGIQVSAIMAAEVNTMASTATRSVARVANRVITKVRTDIYKTVVH